MRVLECVINVSEAVAIGPIAAAGGDVVLDVHSDGHHNRSVLTLAAPSDDRLWEAVFAVSRRTIDLIDLTNHVGVHPRFGALDVVPFVDLASPEAPSTPRSVGARDRFARWAAKELGVPSFIYGPERSLPDVRSAARHGATPDIGPAALHPTAGAVAVGARGALVAYNLWVTTLDEARWVATAVRRPGLRTLALSIGNRAQVSCNLIEPYSCGPADAYDAVAALTPVEGAELVGLLPQAVLERIPSHRWPQLDIGPAQTLEARLPG